MDGAGYAEEANLAWTDADATGADEVGMGMAADGGAHIELQQDYSGPAAPDVGSSVYAPDVGNSVYAPADDDGMETELARAPSPPPSHSSSLSLYREGALGVVCVWHGPHSESCVYGTEPPGPPPPSASVSLLASPALWNYSALSGLGLCFFEAVAAPCCCARA